MKISLASLTASDWFLYRAQIDPSLKIIAFETACPWKQHLFDIEEETQISENAKALYAIFPDEAGQWRVQAIPIDPDSFDSRKPLPEPWRGLRDQALSDISGVPGCVFVHASGFIGGNLTKVKFLILIILIGRNA